jgi:hypothetical protein
LLSLFEHPTLAEMSEQIEILIYAKLEAAADPGKRELAPAGMRREDVA